MSCDEVRIGKTREVRFVKGVTFKEKLEHLTAMGYDVSVTEDEKYIENDFLFIMADGRIFEIIEEKEHGGADIAAVTKNSDGTISYVLKYYNGGTCRDEMLAKAIEDMESRLKAKK